MVSRKKLASISLKLGIVGLVVSVISFFAGGCEQITIKNKLDVISEINRQQKGLKIDPTRFRQEYRRQEYFNYGAVGGMVLSIGLACAGASPYLRANQREE